MRQANPVISPRMGTAGGEDLIIDAFLSTCPHRLRRSPPAGASWLDTPSVRARGIGRWSDFDGTPRLWSPGCRYSAKPHDYFSRASKTNGWGGSNLIFRKSEWSGFSARDRPPAL
jgi:hypothetical protein